MSSPPNFCSNIWLQRTVSKQEEIKKKEKKKRKQHSVPQSGYIQWSGFPSFSFFIGFFCLFFLNSHVYTVVCTVTDRQKQNKKKRIPFFNKCPEFGQIMSPCCCHVVLYMRHPIKVADSISALAFTSVCVSVHLLSAPQKVNNPHDQGMGLLFTAFFSSFF